MIINRMNNKMNCGMSIDLEGPSGADVGEPGEVHLQLVLEAAAAGTWEVDLRTGAVKVSKEQLALHGLSPAARLGFGEWITLVHPADRDRVQRERLAALENGTPYASVVPDHSI
jgi:PAS domain-containing protein